MKPCLKVTAAQTLYCHWNLHIFTLLENERKILKKLKSLIKKKTLMYDIYTVYTIFIYTDMETVIY